MIFRLSFLILFFVTITFGKGYILPDKIIDFYDLSPYMTYTVDVNNSATVDDILHSNNLMKLTKPNLGSELHTVWTKINITNTSSDEKRFTISFPTNYIDNAQVWIIDANDMQINQNNSFEIGQLKPIEDKLFLSRYSVLPITIKANQSIYVIAKVNTTVSPMEVNWLLGNKSLVTKQDIFEGIIWGLFGGFLLTMIIYNIILYIFIREKISLYYVFHSFNLLVFNYIDSNIYHFFINFSSEYIQFIGLISAELISVTMNLLLLEFFKNRFNDDFFPYLKKILIAFNIIFTILISYFVVTLSYDDIVSISLVVGLLNCIFIFVFLIYASYKRIGASYYYLIGYTFFSFIFICYLFYSLGYFGTNTFTKYGVHFAILIDLVFISAVINKKINSIKMQNEKHKQALLETSKFNTISEVVGGIVHQLKTPLSYISNQILLLQSYWEITKKSVSDDEKKYIENLQNNVDFMRDSIHEFYNFYSKNEVQDKIYIKSELQKLLHIYSDKLVKYNISINIDIDEQFYISGSQNSFVNFIMILLENSIEIFLERNTQNPTLNIEIIKTINNTYTFYFVDNGGGIEVKPIEKIFEMHYSNKKSSKMGIGLTLAKNIIEHKFNTKLIAYNSDSGAVFCVNFK